VNDLASPGLAETHGSAPGQGPGFAHASEAEFARILDFYQVDWRYEPHLFPIVWSLDGEVLESFAPDFYLPEFDLYVEMTTLRQKLVRKKNRKLRRLRELYPDIRIKLFYARDFRALMLKYGRVALADALTGAEGQFTPANPGPKVVPDPGGGGARLEERPAAIGPVPALTAAASAASAAEGGRPAAVSRSPGGRGAGRTPSEPAAADAEGITTPTAGMVGPAGMAGPAALAPAARAPMTGEGSVHRAKRRRSRVRHAGRADAGRADAGRAIIDIDDAHGAARAITDEGAAR
jgi:hypothetical protein